MSAKPTPAPRWAAAAAAAAALTPGARETLLLLGHVPLIGAAAFARLSGLRERDTARERLARLAEDALVAAVRPPVTHGRAPDLWYPTRLGIGVLSLLEERSPAALAAERGLGEAALRRRLAALPLLEACYDLAGALAGDPALLGVAPLRAARVGLTGWAWPWRARHGRTGRIVLPAAAHLAWRDTEGRTVASASALLCPDLGSAPIGRWAGAIAALCARQDARRVATGAYHDRSRAPATPRLPLIVAVHGEDRAGAWQDLLRGIAEARGRDVDEYAIAVHTWSGLALVAARCPPPPASRPTRTAPAAAFATAPTGTIPPVTGDPRAGAPVMALRLRPGAWLLLEVLARHPWLTGAELATVLGARLNAVEVDRAALVDLGLALLLPPPDGDRGRPLGRVAELTNAGLEARARWEGLTRPEAERWLGFVGGGDVATGEAQATGAGRAPIGERARLWQTLAHTRGVAETVVGFYAAARRAPGRAGAAVLHWHNASAASAHPVHPDARIRMAWVGATHDALIEYDRGHVHGERWRAKARTWAAAIADGAWQPRGLTVLIVATKPAAALRLAVEVAKVEREAGFALPVLLTITARMWADPDGPLGAIWRRIGALTADERHIAAGSYDDDLLWLPPTGDDETTP